MTNLASPFFRSAIDSPGRNALEIDGRYYSYGELLERSARIAGWLLHNAGPGNRKVGVIASRSIEAYEGVLGACMAGMAYVPLHPDLPVQRLEAMSRTAKLDALVAGPRFPDAVLSSIDAPVLLPDRGPAFQRIAPIQRPIEGPGSDLAYLMFTSGTTGVPKAVMVSRSNVAHFLGAIAERLPIRADDRVSQFYELNFDTSVYDLFATWGAGASLHVVPASQLMAPGNFIRERALTVWSSVPSTALFMQRMKLLRPGAFRSLRQTMFVGEPLLASSAQAWQQAAPGSRVENHYGPTEVTVNCTGGGLTVPARVTPSRGTVSIGTPYRGLHVAVVGEQGRFLATGETGEIAVSGPQVTLGYLDDPDQTSRRFREMDHPQHGRSRWYLTGDLGFEDPDGHFHHLGRLDHQVKVLGKRIELEEVELRLREASGTSSAAVAAWPIEDGCATGLVGFVCGSDRSSDQILAALRAILPSYMVPRGIHAVDALPLLPNGKLDRKALVRLLDSKVRGSAS